MTTAIILALALSTVIYLTLGFSFSRRVLGAGDLMPLLVGREARVNSHREFAASTVAATISLATVLVAFYELVPSLGLWLLWTAVTTALGLLAFGLCARPIWRKMATYNFRPTLHAYLGTEFSSERLALVASIFTTIGYLSAFAVELTVGSRFLASLIPGIPPLLTVSLIALVSFTYTGLGGFRVVVVTDRMQMWFIWLLIGALVTYYGVTASKLGWRFSISHIPINLVDFKWSASLWPFILGIGVMNLLTFISNMGLWQRIAGSESPDVVIRGMWASVTTSVSSWSLLILTAVGAFMFVAPVANQNLLVTLLHSMSATLFGQCIIFCVTLGLYGAMLSTASTQLIAVSHTLYEDVIAPFRQIDVHERVELRTEAGWSRLILVICAVAAVGVVEILRIWGFTVADLAFAVYGAALGLVPPVLLTLIVDRTTTQRLSTAAVWAVSLGFVSCWAVAAYGRAIGDGNLVFLSPLVSTTVAATIMIVGLFRLPSSELIVQR